MNERDEQKVDLISSEIEKLKLRYPNTAWELANPHTKLSYAIRHAIADLENKIPQETEKAIRLTPVLFDGEDLEKGEIAIFFLTDFMHKNKEDNIFNLRPRTLQFLNELGINYRVNELT